MMSTDTFEARAKARRAKRKAIQANVDRRAVLVRESLIRLKAGEGVGLGPLLTQQAEELRNERERIRKQWEQDEGTVAEVADGEHGEGNGGQSSGA